MPVLALDTRVCLGWAPIRAIDLATASSQVPQVTALCEMWYNCLAPVYRC
jgi:hypothetical protein